MGNSTEMFRIGVKFEPLHTTDSFFDFYIAMYEVITNHQPVSDPLHGAGQDQHLYRPYLSDLAMSVPIISV